MTVTFKDNFIGYFTFYYGIVGNRLLQYLALSLVISFLDGVGLALFIPMLEAVGAGGAGSGTKESLGQLHFLTDFIRSVGLEVNINSVLAFLVAVFVFKGMLKYGQMLFYARLKQVFLHRVRHDLLEGLRHLSFTSFTKLDAGSIQNTLTTEVGRLFLTMTSYFSAAQAFVMLGTYVALAFMANYQFALLVCLGSVVSNMIYKQLYRRTKQLSGQISLRANVFNSYLIQAVHYFKYLKATNGFSVYAPKMEQVIDQSEHLNRKIGNMKAIATSIKEPIIITIVSAVIILQVNLMGANFHTILLSLLLFYRALSFLVALQNDWQGFIENIGGMKSISGLLQQMGQAREVQGTVELPALKKGIQLKDVVFRFDSKTALNHVSLNIPVRQTIALVGESGAGKTTIANMVAGLIKPDSGMMTVDGTPVEELNLIHYRSRIGYISQEPVIFNDTIFNNISFWADPTPENLRRFEQVLKLASLDHFVQSLPDKAETSLGDNGILISGGQRQRISIARELYKGCELLIFDEATSALDSETEMIIRENIGKLHGAYTIILIAHRLSTIKEADLIYLLEGGQIVAEGSFDEILQVSARFRKMVSLQTV